MCVQPNDHSKFYLKALSTTANHHSNSQTPRKLFKFKITKGDSCQRWELLFKIGVAQARQREYSRLRIVGSLDTDEYGHKSPADHLVNIKQSFKVESDNMSKLLLQKNGRLLPEDLC